MRVKQELSHFVSFWLLYVYRLVTYFNNLLLQSINLWNIFTRNDEHTDRYHCCYITIGYGKFTYHYTINAVRFAHDISTLRLVILCKYWLSCQFYLWYWNCISYLYLSFDVSSSAYTSLVICYHVVTGLPAIFVGAFYGVTYYVYVQYDLNPDFIYGDVMNEREM